MTQPVARTTHVHYECRLDVQDANDAVLVEELLWTLEGVESVTYCHDGEENLTGLLVVGSSARLETMVKELVQNQTFTATVYASRVIEEEDWAETWKRYWRVERLLPHLVIQPSWEAYKPEDKDTVLKLDPGSAFGTGTHETTQLMLLGISDVMDRYGAQIKGCADVGCGSGILAIYAAKRGIPDVVAIDNDLHALEVALDNARRNDVKISVSEKLDQKTFDLIVANILTNTLLEMMPDLAAKLNPRGFLLLSGIPVNHTHQMMSGLKSYPLQVQRVLLKGGWVAFVCQKTS